MPRVVDATVVPVSVPVSTGLDTAASDDGTGDRYDRLLLRVTLDDDGVGWGEVAPYPSWPGSGTFAEERDALAGCADALVGRTVSTETLAGVVDDCRTARDSPFSAAAVDAALHDALGRHLGESVASLLGGARTDALALHHTLGVTSPERVAREATDAAARGFEAFKLKVGGDLGADLERVEALLSAVPDAHLRVDANGVWDVERAIDAIRRLDEAAGGLAFIEQPVAAADVDGLAAVRAAVPSPIAADEACADAADVHRLADADAVDVVNLKVANAGGLLGATAAARAAAERDLDVLLGGMLELGVGAAATAQFGAVVAPALPTGVFTAFAAASLLTRPERFAPSGPTLAVPDGPGLGVSVDPDALSRHRTDR